MTRWEVRFSAPPPLERFWQGVTAALVGTVAANLEEVLRQPEVVVVVEQGLDVAAAEALEAALDFVWRSGGGLPMPRPQVLAEGDVATGQGFTRLLRPPGLVERICRVSRGIPATIEYSVDNPGLLTLYPVAAHAGTMEFREVGLGRATLVWTVKCLPLPGCAGYVEAFTRLIVGSLAKNLAEHVAR